MYADISKPPKALPSAEPKKLDGGLSLLPPLTRRGHGPGLIVLVAQSADKLMHDGGVPSPLMKWAEEGYTVVEIPSSAWTADASPLKAAVAAIKECENYEDTGKFGLVGM
jgi:carboxymethylenebutenolidase